MKLKFAPPRDGNVHRYCFNCNQDTAREWVRDDENWFYCDLCTYASPRALVFDDSTKWWTAGDGELWHETAGIFVRDETNSFLFFQRSKFPFALTVPAGHVEIGEAAEKTARRELWEETNVRASVTPVATEELLHDQCRRGADAHRWHCFKAVVAEDQKALAATDNTEGYDFVWLSLREAASRHITFATRYMIERYRAELLA